ncbi:MAG: hypothetical protein ACYST6_02670 [Planctomycetota bacterium]|jgi:YD repeat-containing protein
MRGRADKDGYEYQYDYENRIVRITKDGNDIAEFAYDALGRRIRKIDSVAGTTNLYCYNDNWQVVCDYNDGDVLKEYYIYRPKGGGKAVESYGRI